MVNLIEGCAMITINKWKALVPEIISEQSDIAGLIRPPF
jgi:hypothetical protein